MKRKIYFITLIWILSVFSVGVILSLTLNKAYSDQLSESNNLYSSSDIVISESNDRNTIITLAKKTNLVLIGSVSEIGFDYTTILPEKILKGQTTSSSIILRQDYIPKVPFKEGEKVLLFLELFEDNDDTHYSIKHGRKFLVKNNRIFGKVLNYSVAIDELENILKDLNAY